MCRFAGMGGDFLQSTREMFESDQSGYLKEVATEHNLDLAQKTKLHMALKKLGK